MSQTGEERLRALEQLRAELLSGGRSAELEALDQVLAATRATLPSTSVAADTSSATGNARQVVDATPGTAGKAQPKTFLKLKKKYYTPAEVARRVGVSRQTIVKWIGRASCRERVCESV